MEEVPSLALEQQKIVCRPSLSNICSTFVALQACPGTASPTLGVLLHATADK
jgi:hypothetical protein